MKKNIIRPTENSTEQEIRDFVIAILGGDREDDPKAEYPDVKRLRFDFSASNSHDNLDCYINNLKIINILNEWQLLDNATHFYISVWKGDLSLNFTLKKGLIDAGSEFSYNPTNLYCCPFEYSFAPISLAIVTDYYVNLCGWGTIRIITNIIRAITFAKKE